MRRTSALCLVLASLVLGTLTTVSAASASAPANATIKGVITDSRGTPLAGVTVSAWAYPKDDGGPQVPMDRLTVTDAKGRYTLRVEDNDYFVCAGGRAATSTTQVPPTTEDLKHIGECSGGEQPTEFDFWDVHGTSFPVAPGAVVTENLALDDPGRITGTVRATDGTPLEGILVTATQGPTGQAHVDEPGARGVTDEDGVYSLAFDRPVGWVCTTFNRKGTSFYDPAYRPQVLHADETVCDVPSPRVPAGAPGTVTTIDTVLSRVGDPRLRNLETPYFVGTPKVGWTLSARPGAWAATRTKVSYSWFSGSDYLGSGPTLSVPSSAVGERITVRAMAWAPRRAATSIRWTKPVDVLPR